MTPEQVDKLITFGQMALEQGWYDQAREYFEQALALDASNQEAIDGLARVDEILKRKASCEPAKPEVPVAKPVQPEKPEIKKLLDSARKDFEAGHYEQARGYLEQVLELDPSNREAMRLLAQANEISSRRSIPVSYEEKKVRLEAQEERIKVAKLGRRWLVGIGAAIAVFVLLVGFFSRGDLDSTTTRKPMPTATARATRPPKPIIPTPTACQPTTTLMSKRETANGYDWWAATEADRIELCKWWDANQRKVMGGPARWRYVFDGLNEFYRTDEPLILQQKISEIAAMLSLLANLE